MLGMLLLLLLLVLVFSGLGIFVAKWFFIFLVVALLVSLLGGRSFMSGRGT